VSTRSAVLHTLTNLSEWKKAATIVIFFNAIVFAVDLIVVHFYGNPIRLTASWLFGSDDKTTLSSFLFIEAALVIGTGALLAGGFIENGMHSARSPSTPYVTEKLSKQRAEFRETQLSTGLLMMLTGSPLLVLSILSAVL